MMKQKFNIHTHTHRCGHAFGDDEQFVLAAIEAGFETLGFSEHIGYEWFDIPTDRMLYRDSEDYLASIERLKLKYQDRIKIVVGFEIEFYPSELSFLQRMRERVDYMIVGQHCKYVDGNGFDYYCNDEDVLDYANLVVQAIESGLICCVAHPDYFMLGRRNFSQACEEAARRIAKSAVEHHIPLEVNLKGSRKGKLRYLEGEAYPYPFRRFWEVVSEYPIQCIYGWDAHQPTDFLEIGEVERVDEILKGLPLTFLDDFKL